MRTDGRGDRVLARPARNYGEHRATVWWSENELVYLAGDGTTRELDLAGGREETIARGPREGQSWLVDPTGRWATGGTPTFSERTESGDVRLATPLGGCQPYFTAEGDLGYWAAGAGGPIDVIDLESRATRSILRKNDPRLPEGWRYLYFPMISRDRTLLAYAASNGEHHHFEADYEVFVIEIDPESLEPVARPERITRHPGVDRFPDVWRLAAARAPRRAPPASVAGPAAEAGPPVFLWRDAGDPNRRTASAASEVLDAHGAVWTDRLGRLALAGGWFSAAEGRGREIDAELRATNVLSLALLVEPRSVARPATGPIVALSYSDKDRGFLLRQNGRRLELVLRRSNEQGKLGGPGWTIAELPDGGPHHVAIRFSPGRIAAFLDGRPVFREVAPDGFFHWRNRALDFGSEVGGRERFRGLLSQIAIWNRELGDAEIAREAERALATVRGSAAPSRLEVEARLLARSAVPTLEQISPYRRALVVEEYESVRVLAGKPPAGRLRVARWAILDGERLPGAAAPLGTATRLLLEPFDAQPQLESVVLSDTLPAAPRAPLHFEVGLGDG